MGARFFLPEDIAKAITRDGTLRALRRWRGLTPLQLAGRADVTVTRIEAHENGALVLARPELERLAKALRVPPALLTNKPLGKS